MIQLKNLENKKKNSDKDSVMESKGLIDQLSELTNGTGGNSIALLEKEEYRELRDKLPKPEKNETLFTNIMQ